MPSVRPRWRATAVGFALVVGVGAASTRMVVSSDVPLKDEASAAAMSAPVTASSRTTGATSGHPTRLAVPAAKAPEHARAVRLRARPPRTTKPEPRSRQAVPSRSEDRTAVHRDRKPVAHHRSRGPAKRAVHRTPRDPRAVARALLPRFGFSSDQFSCLDQIYVNESGWNVHADNPTSSAYGIPQALPGSKMATAGPDWRDDATTQIRWGLGYIKARYGSPCAAWEFKQSHGWY
jgi:hypothetical protein